MTTAFHTPDEQNLLQHCPRCGYCICGVPLERPCPECGFELDRRWQVFGGLVLAKKLRIAPWRIDRRYLFIVAAPAYLVVTVMPLLRVPPLTLAWIILSGMLVVACAFTVRKIVRPPIRPFIAAGPAGLCICDGEGVSQYAWPTVTSCQFENGWSIALEVEGKAFPVPTAVYFGTMLTEVLRCIRAINAHRSTFAEFGAGNDNIAIDESGRR